ncbi:MAG: Ku protein [Acidimicrobiales bacterium]|jgi:DNA end-binding protein Ku|nr:Ku protein [Acidimicrobiales bacterium]
MARAIWSGTISFGLVSVPVKLYSAAHDEDLHFSQFDKNGNHIRYKRVSEKSGREVDYGDIVKGYEIKRGEWVMVDPEELENFDPKATKTIDIEDFVPMDDIDPIYYERTYYLAPANEAAEKPYRLLLEAMARTGRVAIGKVVIRTKQYLAAIRPLNGVLALSTMRFADEVVAPEEIDAIPSGKARVTPREIELAEQIVDALSADWKPEKYRDTYRERVLDFIDKKAKGQDVVVDHPETEKAEVVDLMAALEASLNAATRGTRAGGSTRAGKRPAKKSSAKKANARKSA